MASSQTIEHLRRVLCDDTSPDLALRFRALFSLKHLAKQGDNAAVDAIAAAFSSESALLKHELAYCLGQSQNLTSLPPLRSVLQNRTENPMVRHEAAEALGALSDPSSLPVLRTHLTDPAEEVRQTCEIAIARIEWANNPASIQPTNLPPHFAGVVDPAPAAQDEDHREKQQEEAQMEEYVANLRARLTDQSVPLFERYRAMFRLRNLVDKNPTLCLSALAAGFADPSALFRHEVAFVLGQIGHPGSVPYLVPVAGDKNEHPMVRHEAVEALGSVGTPEVDAWLREYVKDEERVVRESAVVALDMAEWERSGELEYALIPDGAKSVAAVA